MNNILNIRYQYVQFSEKKVSLFIPCVNEGKYISKCLDSIIALDYPKERHEVLVIDGHSEDGSK